MVYSASIPYVSGLYSRLARRMTNFENHETRGQFEYHLTQKIFVLSFLLAYLSIFMTAWLYLPFHEDIQLFLLHKISWSVAENKPGADRLRSEVIYYAVIAQLISFGTETVAPIVMRFATRLVRLMHRKMGARTGSLSPLRKGNMNGAAGLSEEEKNVRDVTEARLMKQVHSEYYLPEYNIYVDHCEMTIQVRRWVGRWGG